VSTKLGLVEHLIDINGIAEMLGITRQGAYKLVARETTFPAPEVELAAGRIWKREDVERWARETGRIR
jgi:predicted DNA-binding transcriptional regulator AlpA